MLDEKKIAGARAAGGDERFRSARYVLSAQCDLKREWVGQRRKIMAQRKPCHREHDHDSGNPAQQGGRRWHAELAE